MGDVLVRASRDDDSPYLIWSTVVDSPTWVFANRDEAEEFLNDEWRHRNPQVGPDGKWFTPDEVVSFHESDPNLPANRLSRADANGSASFGGSFGWDDERFHVGEGAPPQPEDGQALWWHLPRERLADYARALLDDDEAAAQALLVPEPVEGDDHA